ncbi:MAG: hypothetical protein HC786_17900 [Richelia sp. CSU_2_1]|nr:hypothetical protein [Microcoleus sp. SU_5_6]NJL66558.1 hypothetical protein [Microcoleus sp. SM1_3_4]NJR23889.1 hypothetical protein [Richelia sp. CSU_2_1]
MSFKVPKLLDSYSNSLLSEVQARSITNYQLPITNYQLPITNPRNLPYIIEKGYYSNIMEMAA